MVKKLGQKNNNEKKKMFSFTVVSHGVIAGFKKIDDTISLLSANFNKNHLFTNE